MSVFSVLSKFLNVTSGGWSSKLGFVCLIFSSNFRCPSSFMLFLGINAGRLYGVLIIKWRTQIRDFLMLNVKRKSVPRLKIIINFHYSENCSRNLSTCFCDFKNEIFKFFDSKSLSDLKIPHCSISK